MLSSYEINCVRLVSFQHRGPEKPVYKPKPKFNTEDEPLLRENPHRFVLLPIQYKDIWQMYKKAEGKRMNFRSEGRFSGFSL